MIKYAEKKKKENFVKTIEVQKVVKSALHDIKDSVMADRTSIIQFHNGEVYNSGHSVQKMLCTFEEPSPGIARVYKEEIKSIPTGHYTTWLDSIFNGGGFVYKDTEDIPDFKTKYLFKMGGTKSTVCLPVYNKNSLPVGILIIDWVAHEAPDFCDLESFHVEGKTEEEQSDAILSEFREKYISQLGEIL